MIDKTHIKTDFWFWWDPEFGKWKDCRGIDTGMLRNGTEIVRVDRGTP